MREIVKQRPPRTPRFDLTEVFLVSILAAFMAWWGATQWTSRALASSDWEVDALAERYGPDRHSQYAEEWIIRDFFGDTRNGTFVDIGAGHHKNHSNTFYLETELGWSGLAIDAQSVFADSYARHRPRTRFLTFFVSSATGETAELWLSEAGSGLASSNKRQAEQLASATSIEIPTIRLDDLLDRVGMRSFDFLSMDIELAEPEALAGFSINRYAPRLVCIEAHPPTRQFILDYFQRHGYVLAGKYLRADNWNLYFVPARPHETLASVEPAPAAP